MLYPLIIILIYTIELTRLRFSNPLIITFVGEKQSNFYVNSIVLANHDSCKRYYCCISSVLLKLDLIILLNEHDFYVLKKDDLAVESNSETVSVPQLLVNVFVTKKKSPPKKLKKKNTIGSTQTQHKNVANRKFHRLFNSIANL